MSDPQAVRSRLDGRDRAPAQPGVGSPKRLPRKQQSLLLVVDVGLAEAFLLGSLWLVWSLSARAGQATWPSEPLLVLLAVLFPLVVVNRGLYRFGRSTSRRRQSIEGARVVAWSVGISATAIFLFSRDVHWSLRVLLVLYHGLLLFWMAAVRPLLVSHWQRRLATISAPDRVLVYGSGSSALEIGRKLSRGPTASAVVGFADQDAPEDVKARPFHPIALDELPCRAEQIGATLVVLARTDLPREQVVRISDELAIRGIRVRVARNIFNTLVDGLPGEGFGGLSLLPMGRSPLSRQEQRLKRGLDLAGVCLGGLLTLPFTLALALLVRLSSPGPVLYRQTRIGRQGRPFTFYKFRSMRTQNDDSVHRRYVRQFVENGGAAGTDESGRKIYKLVDDARVTRIGRFLRRTSLDELPQLINVLRGEMSLVGPRPCLPFEYDLYKDWQKRRLDVTPGMTGLWQVTGRSYVNFEDMVLLDLFYIGNWSFSMDLKLLLRTAGVVVWGKGGV